MRPVASKDQDRPHPAEKYHSVFVPLHEPASCVAHQTPLSEVLKQLGVPRKLEIVFPPGTLRDLGISADTRVTLQLRDVKRASLLSLILEQYAASWEPGGDSTMLSITGAKPLHVYGVKYQVRDLVMAAGGDADVLTDLLMTTIRPATWQPVGGRAWIREDEPGTLTVAQSYHALDEITRLLEDLRQVRRR
jgi:hypothetical protein